MLPVSSTPAMRRLFAAPDGSHELIATCSRGWVPYGRYDSKSCQLRFTPCAPRRVITDDEEERCSIELPFPATDLSWCPAKAGADNASFLVACNSQPLQLWDVQDADLRASYVAFNDTGNHTHPRCCGWLTGSSGQLLAVGGYGGHEDGSPVRFFDVMREGDAVLYAYDSSHHAGASMSNNVVSAVAAAPLGVPGMAAAGYRNHATVDVIDLRHRCPAAVLRAGPFGDRGCIRTLRPHPSDPFLIFASGVRAAREGADERVVCWDLRQPRVPLAALSRGPAPIHLVCDFVFIHGSDAGDSSDDGGAPHGDGWRLVATSAAGGLRVYNVASALLSPGVMDVRPVLVEELGVTGGITSLEQVLDDGSVTSAGVIAVVVGARTHTFHRQVSSNGIRNSNTKRARTDMSETYSASSEEMGDVDEGTAAKLMRLLHPRRPSARAVKPLSDCDEDGELESAGSAALRPSDRVTFSETNPDVAVVSLF